VNSQHPLYFEKLVVSQFVIFRIHGHRLLRIRPFFHRLSFDRLVPHQQIFLPRAGLSHFNLTESTCRRQFGILKRRNLGFHLSLAFEIAFKLYAARLKRIRGCDWVAVLVNRSRVQIERVNDLLDEFWLLQSLVSCAWLDQAVLSQQVESVWLINIHLLLQKMHELLPLLPLAGMSGALELLELRYRSSHWQDSVTYLLSLRAGLLNYVIVVVVDALLGRHGPLILIHLILPSVI